MGVVSISNGLGVTDNIREYLLNRDDIVAAYLFGSRARGTARSSSDIDIALLLRDPDDPPERDRISKKLDRFDRRLEIAGELETIARAKVDVIDMEEAPLALRHQILTDGILLVDKDEQRRIDFEVSSRRQYFDFRRFIERRDAAMIAGALEDTSRG